MNGNRLFHRANSCASTGLARLNENQRHSGNAIYNGGTLWADYGIETVTELRSDLVRSGKLNEALIDKFLAHCSDFHWWTQTIAFTAVNGRTLVVNRSTGCDFASIE